MTRVVVFAVAVLCASAPLLGCSGDDSEPIDDGTPRSSGGPRNNNNGGAGNNRDPFDDDGEPGDTVGSSSGGESSSGESSSGASSGGESSSGGAGSSGAGGSSGIVNPGGAAYGESCFADADCESGICNTTQTTGVLKCSKPCESAAECQPVFPHCQLETDPDGNRRPNATKTCRKPE